MSDRMKVALGLLAFVLLMGIVGHFDAEEEERQAEEYCHNVKSGIWPDYEGTYKEFCKSSTKTLDEAERSK